MVLFKRSPRVLIIDTDETASALRGAQLRAHGMDTLTAVNGIAGLDICNQWVPDVVVADNTVPEMDSLELASAIKEGPTLETTCVIIMTDGINSTNRWKLLDNGIDDIISKSISEDEFVTRIRTGARIHFLQEEIKQLNLTDPLTGLFNRQYIEQILETEVNRAARYGEMLCCMIVDCHLFKSINEKYGHACGDAVLRYSAKMLRDIIRDSDMVGRYGDDDFIIILPKTTLDSCRQIIDRIMECSEEEVFVWNGHEITVTFLVGAAEFDYNECNTVAKLLQVAEREMNKPAQKA